MIIMIIIIIMMIIIIIKHLFVYPRYSLHLKSAQQLVQFVFVRSRSNWNLAVLAFEERGKPGEKPLRGRREPTTNSTHVLRRDRELNRGYVGGRRVLSTLRHSCSPGLTLLPHSVRGHFKVNLILSVFLD